MEFIRTANAGGLLTLDGVTFLLDGISNPVEPYEATPDWMRRQLLTRLPDALAFTHSHPDHFDSAFSQSYQATTHRPIYGAVNLQEAASWGQVRLTPIPLRHLGKPGQGAHCSFLIEGSRRIWFMGDASPLQWEPGTGNDYLFAPFAYANTPQSWKKVCDAGFRAVVLLHMPAREKDSYGIWDSVLSTLGPSPKIPVWIPALGESVTLP